MRWILFNVKYVLLIGGYIFDFIFLKYGTEDLRPFI